MPPQSQTTPTPASGSPTAPFTPQPRPVQVVDGSTLVTSGGQTQGMTRQNALSDVSDQMCGNIMLASPHSSSAVHHHGPQDTLVYAVRGRGSIRSDGGKRVQHLKPGDWALIPAFAVHQEVNEGEEEVEWVIVRGGRVAQVVNLDGWEGLAQ